MDLPDTLPARFEVILDRLAQTAQAAGRRAPKRRHGDSYQACCPAHDDRNPSLALSLESHRVLVHCFAGCETANVMAAIGVPMEALFSDYRNGSGSEVPRLAWGRGNGEWKAEVQAFVEELYGPPRRVSELDDRPLALPPTAREFLELEFPPIEPLLGPISTQQLIMLYAPPGAGKTMFALALAHALAAGRDFLGWTSSRPSRVLYVDGEMAGEEMQSRLVNAGLEELRVANLANWAAEEGYEPLNLCDAAGRDVVNVWVEATDSEVVVLDNLMSLASIDGMSMSSDEFWQPLRRFTTELRASGKTIIVVDHTNAAGEIFGTKTKLWHANLAMKLIPMQGSETVETGFEMTVPPTRFRLVFSKVRGTGSSAGQETAEKVVTVDSVGRDWRHTLGRIEQRMMAREMRDNGLSIRDIAEELGVPRSTVGRWLK